MAPTLIPSHPKPHLHLPTMISTINSTEVIATVTSEFVCKICHNFMIDICTLPCDHKFCKFCCLSWLRLDPTCPLCQEETYKPFSSRCYEMDSVIDDFYPLLYQFYGSLGKTKDGKAIVSRIGESATRNRNSELENFAEDEDYDFVESIQDLRKQMNEDSTSFKPIQIHSPSDREKVRKTRRAISERKDILLAAPCTSILQKLATLGWGTSTADQSINSGMRMMVWTVLCFVFWNFLYTFHHPWFDGGVRTFFYSCLILLAVNVLQKQLFEYPEQGADLLDFELWMLETPANTVERVSNDLVSRRITSMGESRRSIDASSPEGAMGSPGNADRRCEPGSQDTVPSSQESFKDCDDSEHISAHELQQILRWKSEGKLDLGRMFKMTDAIMSSLFSQ